MAEDKVLNYASSPSVSQIIVPVANSSLTLQYKPQGMIGDQVFPTLPITAPSQKILKYSKANMLRFEPNTLERAEGGETKIFNWEISSSTINPIQLSSGESVTVEQIDIEQMPGQIPTNSIVDAVQHCFARIDLARELAVANAVYNNTWADATTGGYALGGTWALDGTSNTFIADIYNAKSDLVASTGYKPTTLCIDYSTFVAIQKAKGTDVAERIKYSSRDVRTTDLLAELLELDEVIVGSAVYTTSQESKKKGASYPTMSQVWNPSGKGNAFLYHKEAPGLRVATAGMQFRLPYRGSLQYVEGYYDYRIRSYVYTATIQLEVAPVMTDLGYAFSECYHS